MHGLFGIPDMKLFHSPTSPYARKCLALAIEKGVERDIALFTVSPMANPAELLAVNPLSKVPALVLADGRSIIDSRVICQHIDGIVSSPRLIPADPAARIDCLTREAQADGINDAAFSITMERKRPAEQQSPDWIERWIAAISRSVAYFETRVPPREQPDLGDIALACALGYLDLRHGAFDWRASAPNIASWFAAISARPSLARTAPPPG